MKKIFTLLFGSLLTLASFAADRRPVMNIDNNSYYKVLVDGMPVNNFRGEDICDINYGRHTITVLETRRSFWGRRARIVSTTDFRVDGDDKMIAVNIDRTGCVRISKSEFRNNDRDYGWRDRDNRGWNDDHDYHRDYDNVNRY